MNNWSLWQGPIVKVLEIVLIALLWSEGREKPVPGAVSTSL
jgi:hypothetical protein